MSLSVMVLTYNRDVLPCLEAIKSNTHNKHDVILVDNGNNYRPEYKDLVDIYIGLKENEGVLARNYGRLIAKGDYILNIDDDVIVLPDWDQILIDFIESDDSIVASGQMGFNAYSDLSNFNRMPRKSGDLCDFITGFCWAYKNLGNDQLPLDWFSPNGKPSVLHDETYIQAKMRKAGGKFIVSPIVCQHDSQRNSVDFEDDADKIKRIQKEFKVSDLHLESTI